MKTATLLPASSLMFPFSLPADTPEAEALLKTTGITGGVAVHLGCGEGAFTAALGKACDALLVHGLDVSAEKVAAAKGSLYITLKDGTVICLGE